MDRVIYNLPYDSEVEYLESTGTQYLNLGRIPWDKEILFETLTAYTKHTGVGREGSSNALYMGYNENRYETAWMTYYGTLDNNYHIISKKLSYKYNPQKLFSYIDGVEVFRYDMNIEKDSAYAYDLLVFAICGIDGPGFYMYCKEKYFKVIVDGVTVHDLIPVRVGNIGYMYDKITGKLFRNKGTGNFILGPDIANQIPKIRNVIYTEPLYDAEIEYLEKSHKSLPLITIPIKPSTNYIYKWKCKILYLNDWSYTFSTSAQIENLFIFGGVHNDNKSYLRIKSSSNKNGTQLQTNILYECMLCKNGDNIEEYFNDVLYVSLPYQDFTAPDYLIFPGSNMGTIQLYYLQILDSNNNLIADLIPVRKGQSGCLYDKVSRKLLPNEGNDSFVLGQDIRLIKSQRCVLTPPYESNNIN